MNVYRQMEKSDLGLSEYIRKCIMGKEIKVVSDIKELVWALNRIGNNLNQLARKVNEGKVMELGDNLSQINCNLNTVFENIVKIL